MTRSWLGLLALAAALPAWSENLIVGILSPAIVANDPMAVEVSVIDDVVGPTDGADGVSVTVTMGGLSKALTKGTVCLPSAKPPCGYPAWVGSFDVSTLASGTYDLVATATNSTGQTFSDTRSVTLDRRPAIQVQKPAWNAATRRTLDVSATCTDDYGCVSLTLELSGSVLLAGTDKVEGLVDLFPTGTSLQLKAVDTRGQVTQKLLTVFVEDGPDLRAVATVPGELLDADATRLLYRDETNRLFIRDRATGNDTLAHPAATFVSGLLTTAGAVIVAGSTIKTLENGTLTTLPGAGSR
jgi:hypothetical protein